MRPVQASAEPSPRTSTPARSRRPAQLGARRDLLHRLEASARAGRRSRRRGPPATARASARAASSAAVERLARRAWRPSARAAARRGRPSARLLQQRGDACPSGRSRSRRCARSVASTGSPWSVPLTVAVSGPPNCSVQATSAGVGSKSAGRRPRRGRAALVVCRPHRRRSRACFAGSGPLPSGSTRTVSSVTGAGLPGAEPSSLAASSPQPARPSSEAAQQDPRRHHDHTTRQPPRRHSSVRRR